jgi:transcriptional regulator with XRE-family HTH domain
MLGNFLKQLVDSGYKQIDIARRTNIKPSHINKLLKGEAWSLETAIKIADTFEVSIDEVIGRKPARTITLEEELLLQTTAGDKEIARAALRSAQGEKLIKEQIGEKGRGERTKAA